RSEARPSRSLAGPSHADRGFAICWHHCLCETSAACVARTNPRKRVGTAEDIAGLTIFLCSRAGAYTIGETICCDGGVAIS
ncbi:MAG: SDR family oxidoreductase, partial [Actinomycetota bacterium]|nr:SDR family oxidoreductase [Actinomycetota bacterium]